MNEPIPNPSYAIFDFDPCIYRCGFASQHKTYAVVAPDGNIETFKYKKELREKWPDVPNEEILTSIEVEPVENALHSFKILTQGVLNNLGITEYEGYLSDGPGFRGRIAETLEYKGNRDPTHKPVHYTALRQYAEEIWGAKPVAHIEADDACGISAEARRGDGVIVSNDKDLDTIVGWHYNFVTEELYWVSPRSALLSFYEQLLTGDVTDNIPGIYGIGPVKAKELLAGVETPEEAETRVWEKYKETYEDLEKAKDRFIETARLVYILRKPEEVETLWEPRIDLD